MQILKNARNLRRLLKYYTPEYARRQARHDYQEVFEKTSERMRSLGIDIKDKRVLDVGCGRRFPQTLLCHSYGARITGIDVQTVSLRRGLGRLKDLVSQSGPVQGTMTYFEELRLSPPYYRELDRVCPFPLTTKGIDVRKMDVTTLDFPEGTFDVVISNAAFEHIDGVPKAISELKRVMKKGALAHINIHLFTSLTGAHEVLGLPGESLILGDTSPWEHLRKRDWHGRIHLNNIREGGFRQMFEAQFRLIDWIREYKEGEEYLTPDIRKELGSYSEEELLTRGITAIVQK